MTFVERWKRKLGLAAPPTSLDARRPSADELTGLSNRTVMHETLVAALRSGSTGGVVLFDLDSFKYFNDRHGHRLGDELLRVVARRLREHLASASCLARVGGDRFMAFLPGLTPTKARASAQACVEAMRVPVTLASGAEIVTLCAGVAVLGAEAGRAVDVVWRACDAALHAAKVRGRDRVVAFDGDTRQAVAARRAPTPTVAALQERQRAQREEARTDALTGLRNRLALDELLHDAGADADWRGDRAAVAFIDVDHFGDYGHVHGDAAGDEALRTVARALRACAREEDFVFRKGGKEFVVVLPDTGDAAGDAVANAAAERMRAAVEALALPRATSAAAGVVSVTIGVASGPAGSTLRQLLDAAAEKAMAGQVGEQRNRVHAVRLRDCGAAG